MADRLELTYRARNGRPPVDLDLRVESGAVAHMFVGTSFSLPGVRLNRVGMFAGPAPADLLAGLVRYINDHDLFAHAGAYGEASPSMPGRFAEISLEGRVAQFRFVEMTAGAELDGFERLLQDLARAMTGAPRAAAEACLELHVQDGTIHAAIELRSIGSEAMNALFVDPAEPLYSVFAALELSGRKEMPNKVVIPMDFGMGIVPAEAVAALADSGVMPLGVAAFEPGATLRFEVPPMQVPAATGPVSASGRIEFWWPDGKARRSLIVLTPEVLIP